MVVQADALRKVDWLAVGQTLRSADTQARVLQASSQLQRLLLDDPIVRRFALEASQNYLQGRIRMTTTPLQAMGEHRIATVALAQLGRLMQPLRKGPAPVPGSPTAKLEDQSVFGSYLSLLAHTAALYHWSDSVAKLVSGAPLPKHVIARNLLPHPVCFWVFESSPTYVSEQPDGSWLRYSSDWMLAADFGHGIFFAYDMANDERREVYLEYFVIPYGITFPDDLDGLVDRADRKLGEEKIATLGLVLKRVAFINSPYVETRVDRLPRPARREFQHTRAMAGQPEPICHTVLLRRPAADAQTQMERDLAAGRVYKHRWWVSGHYRAQWYPSERSHKVVWIAPYLKGDPSAPLIEKVYTVQR